MDESNYLKIDKTNLTKQAKIRLDKITGLKIIFIKRLIKENYAVKNQVNMLLLLITWTIF